MTLMEKQTQPDKTKKIIITGFGGQGVILAGHILGQAASLGDHKESTLIESYGPESRGGACSAQVIISEKTIHYPYINTPDILICLSQSGYEKYSGQITQKATLLIDQDLVHNIKGNKSIIYSMPATRKAEELGQKMMANIIILGFATAITNIISVDAACNAIADSVPKGTEKHNVNAFNKGYDYGLTTLKGIEKKAGSLTGILS
jgi:2-oxoglutarate ferredoxin oxidoreductase subunit gamma